MKHGSLLLVAGFVVSSSIRLQAEEAPVTLMTKPGRQLLSEDFSKPLPPPQGSTAQFASGFQGWRCNVVPRGGRWEVVDGEFRGVEDPQVHHPATASYGFDFKNAIIECEVRMEDAPLEGRKSRFLYVRTTDAKDYVCSIILTEKGFRIQKDDNDHGGPDVSVPLAEVKTPVKLGDWQKVTFEILGDEMVGTVNGKSLAGVHPLIASEKHSVMFVAGVQGAVRNLRIWEALPNPEWPKNREAIHVDSSKP